MVAILPPTHHDGSTRDDRAAEPETGASARPGLLARAREALAKPLANYYLIVASSSVLIALGILMVLSASSVYGQMQVGDSFYFVKRQLVFMLVGLIAAVMLGRASLRLLSKISWVALVLAFMLLILTYTPLGVTVNGNTNWLEFGTTFLRFQPAEFAKLALVIWSANLFAAKERLLDQPKHLLVPFVPAAGLMVLLVVFQGDLGTAVIMAGMLVGIMLVVGTPKRILLLLGAAGLVAVAFMTLTSGNRMRRLLAFVNPAADIDGANHQATVGVYALATGGWTGTGIGASRQKWGSLPEAHTDYIFAVIGEELGLLGALLVLLLFFILGFAGLRVALNSTEMFPRVMAAGVTTWFLFQALVNLGVVLRLLPVLGVPLPMLSYGGSALLANMMALGVLVACARNEPGAQEALRQPQHRGPKPAVTTVVGRRG